MEKEPFVEGILPLINLKNLERKCSVFSEDLEEVVNPPLKYQGDHLRTSHHDKIYLMSLDKLGFAPKDYTTLEMKMQWVRKMRQMPISAYLCLKTDRYLLMTVEIASRRNSNFIHLATLLYVQNIHFREEF